MVLKDKIFFLVLICFGLAACRNQPNNNSESMVNDCIDKILNTDAELGAKRNHECEVISLSETIRNYTDALASLDYSGCPNAFNVAFNSHINAWNEMINLTNNYDDLRGEMHDLFDQIEEGKDSSQFKPLLAKIWSTWADIEKTAEE